MTDSEVKSLRCTLAPSHLVTWLPNFESAAILANPDTEPLFALDPVNAKMRVATEPDGRG